MKRFQIEICEKTSFFFRNFLSEILINVQTLPFIKFITSDRRCTVLGCSLLPHFRNDRDFIGISELKVLSDT